VQLMVDLLTRFQSSNIIYYQIAVVGGATPPAISKGAPARRGPPEASARRGFGHQAAQTRPHKLDRLTGDHGKMVLRYQVY
jgi:hypothetical protein